MKSNFSADGRAYHWAILDTVDAAEIMEKTGDEIHAFLVEIYRWSCGDLFTILLLHDNAIMKH